MFKILSRNNLVNYTCCFLRGDNEKQDAFTETYLSIISAALEDEFFIFDYHNTHSIDIQLQTLSDFHPQMYPLLFNVVQI